MSCSVTERVTSRAGVGAPTGTTGNSAAASGAATRCRGRRGTDGSAANLTTSPNLRSTNQEGGPPQNGPQSSPQGAPFRSKPCCSILWCCCCKCPCSNPGNKGNDENGTKKNSNSELDACEAIPTPSVDEIRSWGKSFDKLMKSPAGRKVFRDFLKGEYSEENILFWLACEDLKKQTNKEVIEERARLIYEDYISILSPKEVSLDSRVREIVNRNMVEPTPNTFDEAQVQIYTLMHRDSYPRFVNSQMYKSLAQIDKQDKDLHQQPTSSTSSIISVDLGNAQSQSASVQATASTPLLGGAAPAAHPVQVTSARDQADGS
ncbi:regulator of G-protein signaling 17 [Cylas formicarius]|uniref:regulator of G-protein signaling 17 n=1 Tax=Cylas formicarius TaxID=197179 RepID=UPI00295868ED|nr:regulator of G-protein signaling 17 [Cylas formicarius]